VFGKHTKIVIDRFHVAKLYRKGFDSLRIQELKRLKKELNEEEYAELKGAMWVLRKQKKDLTVKDRASTQVVIWIFT
jgi:transposase